MTGIRIRKAALPGLVCLAWLLFASPSFGQMGQVYEDFGVGPRDSGMGNTGTAAANDFSASFYNPGALVRAKGLQFNFGYKGVYPHLYLKLGKYHDRYFTRYPETHFFLMGISWNVVAEKLIDPKWTERFTLGLAFSISDYYKSFSIYYDMDTPYYFRYHDRYLNLLPIYFAMSVRMTDWLSIGGGLVPAPSDTYTRVTVDSHFALPRYRMWANQGVVTRAYGKLEPLAGILVRIPDKHRDDFFSIGAVWRDEVSSIDGNGHAYNTTHVHYEGTIYQLPAVPTKILTLTGWSPMQVAAGLSFRPTDDLTVTVEELWKRWSHWKNFFNETPGPRFNDTWNTRFGMENIFRFDHPVVESFSLRLGGYREHSPVPDQNGESNYLDPDKWVSTLGFDTAWLDPFDIFRTPIHAAVSGQLHLMDRMSLHNKDDPDFPELDSWGEIWSVTGSLGIGIP